MVNTEQQWCGLVYCSVYTLILIPFPASHTPQATLAQQHSPWSSTWFKKSASTNKACVHTYFIKTEIMKDRLCII